MPIKVGDMVIVGDRYAGRHYYTPIVGQRLRVIEIRLPGINHNHTKVVVEGDRKDWFIREEDAVLVPQTNQDALRFLHEECP